MADKDFVETLCVDLGVAVTADASSDESRHSSPSVPSLRRHASSVSSGLVATDSSTLPLFDRLLVLQMLLATGAVHHHLARLALRA